MTTIIPITIKGVSKGLPDVFMVTSKGYENASTNEIVKEANI